MKRDALRGFLQIGIFLTVLSGCSLLFQPRDSGEFVISVCSTGVGLLLLLIVIVMWVAVR